MEDYYPRRGKRKVEVNMVERKSYPRKAKIKASAAMKVQQASLYSFSSDTNMSQGVGPAATRKNITSEKLGKIVNKQIPAAIDPHSCQQSDQQSSFNLSRNIRAVTSNMGKTCLSRAPSVSVPVMEAEVAANDLSNIMPQGDVGAKPTLVKESPKDRLVNLSSDDENHGQSCNLGAPPVSVPLKEAEVAANGNASRELSMGGVGANSLSADGNHGTSCKLGLTEVVNLYDSGEDEVESSTPLVSVGGYRVKKEAAGVLKEILEKHGDIAAGMTEQVESRSVLLGQVCDFVQVMYQKKFADITQGDIESFSATVRGFKGLKLEVGWLKKSIEEIQEAKKVIRNCSSLKEEHDRHCKVIRESTRAIRKGRKMILEAKQKLEVARKESKTIKEKVENTKATINLFGK